MKKLLFALTLSLVSSLSFALNSPYEGVYTLLASGARTATQNGADQTNRYVSGIEVFCNVTAASGTGGLQVQIQGKDPLSGTYYVVSTTNANVATGGIRNIIGANVFNVAATTTSVAVNTYVPYIWRISVVHGDASSYTYSCGYTLYSSS